MPALKLNKNVLPAAILTVLSSASANAQLMLEEVVVTAQKRAENLQDTVIAITAIGGDMMDDFNISNGSDYEVLVPSLTVRDSPARVFIRGIGRVTNSLGVDPGVAFYSDQVYSS